MTTLNSISNISVQFQTTRLMRAGREDLFGLQAQISSGKKTEDLSTLGATNTRRLLEARASELKYNSYIDAIQTVTTRVKVQSQSLAGMQNIAAQMNTLINNNQTQVAALGAGADAQIRSYLLQTQVYLNQQVENRYVFAGNRYGTLPVRDLNSLPVPPTESYPFTPLTSPTLPNYDSDVMSETQVTSMTVNGSGQLVLGSSTWADQGYAVGDTVTLSGMSTAGNNTTFTISSLSGTTATLTVAATTQAADTSFTAVRNSATAGPGAYNEDALFIDDGFSLDYGITSTDPGIQNLILGLRWAYAATQDSTNYTTYMARASELLGSATSQIRILEADAAADLGVLSNTLESHKKSIIDFKNQAGEVIDADVNEAATQLSILSSQIEASYAATGRVINLSIVNYL